MSDTDRRSATQYAVAMHQGPTRLTVQLHPTIDPDT